MFENTAKLRAESFALDAMKNPVPTYTDKTVFVKPRSLYASDFYQAAQAGLKPSVVLEMFAGDYAGQDVVLFDSKEYTVVRAYQKPDRDTIELTLELRHRNGGL